MSKITLCGKSAAEYTLLPCSGEVENHAAEVLRDYFQKIDNESLSGGDGMIELKIAPLDVRADGYRIVNRPGRLEITGVNGRGLLYGVYNLLEKYLGFRSFVPGLERIGEGGDIPETEECFSPFFEYRHIDCPHCREVNWCVANHINNYAFTDGKYGGFMKWGGFVHTMHLFTGVSKLEQPCLSDPQMLKSAILYTRDLLEKDPKIKLISISQNDNENYCTCPQCTAVDEEEGSHMGTLLRFVNAVAEDIKDDYPDVAIETLAYRYTRKAPKKVRPLPNVIIRLCSIECCFSHPLSDPTCQQNLHFAQDIRDWSSICDRLYIWDYVTNFAHYLPTFPNFGVLRENMRFYALHGVKGMFPEANFQSVSGEFSELRSYLLAKLMWNPMMSEVEYQTHMNEFLEGYYGAGWRHILNYINLLVGLSKQRHMGIYNPPFVIIPEEAYRSVYDLAEACWDAAEREAGDRLEAVKRSRLQWTYLSLTIQPDEEKGRAFYHTVNDYGIRWRENQNYWPEEQDYTLSPPQWTYHKR